MYIQNKKGFTLIELIVSLGIFSIVMTLVAGTYFSLISVSTNMRTSTSAINNVTSVLNTMSDDIRNGTCSSGQCSSGTSQLIFTNASDVTVTYSLCTGKSAGQICKSVGGGASYVLTHSPVNIASLKFVTQNYTSTTGTVSARQKLIIIRIDGKYKSPHNTGYNHFYLETVVTPHKIYIY